MKKLIYLFTLLTVLLIGCTTESNQGTKTRTEGQTVLDDNSVRFRANLPNNEILALFKNNNENITIVFSVGYDEIISEEYIPN